LSIVKPKLGESKYICALCRLIRRGIIDQYLKSAREPYISKIRAITDGTSLNNMTICPDSVDMDSLSLSDFLSKYPVFTSLIGLDKKSINDFLIHISPNLKKFDYCAFKPVNQEFNLEVVQELYQNLGLKELVEKSLTTIEDIKLYFDVN
ncbi:MAG: hypothetical protein ACFE9R_03445, partial [Candidatus Hermodarchaeota archaeon]